MSSVFLWGKNNCNLYSRLIVGQSSQRLIGLVIIGHHCLSHLGWRVQWPESLSVHLALHSAQYRLHTLHKSGTAQSALYMYIAVHTQKLHNRHKTASKIHTVKQCGWGRPSYSSITVGLHCPPHLGMASFCYTPTDPARPQIFGCPPL